jgi:glycosyltransferase involved in cell wall biosynthesis
MQSETSPFTMTEAGTNRPVPEVSPSRDHCAAAPQKRRLLHVLGYAIRGGCETCSLVFIRHELEFEHHVIVLGEPGPMTAAWQALGATVHHLDVLGSGWMEFYRRLRRELNGAFFDGVILWAGIRVPLVLAALANKSRDLPVVIHAGNPFEARRRVRAILSLSGMVRMRPRRVTVIGCSTHVAVSFQRAPFYGDLRVETCLNPVEAPPANPHRPRLLQPDLPVHLGMVARLDPIKDHATLLRAFPFIRSRWPRAELHLAGDGPLRGELESLAAELGITPAVRFLGSIGDVPAFLQTLDVFCYVTSPREGMGNALAEAMAAGLPCVVNDLPVMHEVAGGQAEHAAAFAATRPEDLGRAIDGLLRNDAERRRLSDAAWRRASEVFSPRRVIDRYLAALETPQCV